MTQLSPEDERVVERLAFFMLKETYGALAILLRQLNPAAAQDLFDGIERQIAWALERIHAQQAEGPNSAAIATAVAATLVEVLNGAHRTQGGTPSAVTDGAAPGEADAYRQSAAAILSSLRRQATAA